MDATEWSLFCDTIRVAPTGNLRLLPKPGDAQLDHFETLFTVKLPKSYRAFAKRFGSGEIASIYTIRVPGDPIAQNDEDPLLDLHQFNMRCREFFDRTFLEKFPHPERVQRLVLFGEAYGDYIGWDPMDVRNDEGHEYGIYELGSNGKRTFLAASFPVFVKEVCCVPPHSWPQDEELYRTFTPTADWR